MSLNPWYHIDNIETIDTPALVVHPQRVQANINTAIAMVKDVARLRPHVKTNKSPDAVELMMRSGITKFKCATIAEAEMLGQLNAPDVLLAYQLQAPKIDRFIQLIKQYPQTEFSCLVDNITSADLLSTYLSEAGLTCKVFIDLNVGMNRTGIVPGEEAFQLYKHVSGDKNLTTVGIHAYDGHMRNPDLVQRTRECDEAYAMVIEIKNKLESAGFDVPVIIVGGSPSFP